MQLASGTKTSPSLLEGLRKELFWDVDAAKLDPEQHAHYLIERVAERGNLEDMKRIWNYYGPGRIRDAVVSARGLSNRTVCFFATMFDLPLESFRSYRRGSSDVVPA